MKANKMSFLKTITDVLGITAQKAPELPTPTIPAAQAPGPRNNTGKNVIVGSDSVANKRINSGTSKTTGIDPLAGLGKGSGIQL